MSTPTPPEPIFDPNFLNPLGGTPSNWHWQQTGTDPNGTAIGTIANVSTSAPLFIGMGGGSSPAFYCSATNGSGFDGLPMYQTDASKILAAGASISSGHLVSGGNTYSGQQYSFSSSLIIFRLV